MGVKKNSFLYTAFYFLVPKKIEQGAFGGLLPNTLAVSSDKNYGKKVDTAKYFIGAVTSFIWTGILLVKNTKEGIVS